MSLRHLAIGAGIVTAATLAVWIGTGAHAYTKYEVVKTITKPVDAGDPLAGTGFYGDDREVTTTVHEDEFHLGLLPTPERVFDRHLLAVVPVLGLTWAVVALGAWRRIRKC